MGKYLVTEELDVDLGKKHREQVIGNFKILDEKLVEQEEGKNGITAIDNAKNIEKMVEIMKKYEIPIDVVNGKVVELEE